MRQGIKSALLILALLALGACSTSQALLNPSIGLPPERELTPAELHEAILTVLQRRGWQVRRNEPGVIYAAISLRQRHHASIAVEYSPFDVQIRYRSSQGLNYRDGKIHRNYNRWVNNLRADIQQQLNLPKNPE